MAGGKVFSTSQLTFLKGLINAKTLRLSTCTHRHWLSEAETDRKGSLPRWRYSIEDGERRLKLLFLRCPFIHPLTSPHPPEVRLTNRVSILIPNASFTELCRLPCLIAWHHYKPLGGAVHPTAKGVTGWLSLLQGPKWAVNLALWYFWKEHEKFLLQRPVSLLLKPVETRSLEDSLLLTSQQRHL